MRGLGDLLASERGVFCVAVLLLATVLAVTKVITGADWLTFTKWLAITLVASKTATGAIDQLASNKGTTT